MELLGLDVKRARCVFELVGFLLRYHCGIDLGVLRTPFMQCNVMRLLSFLLEFSSREKLKQATCSITAEQVYQPSGYFNTCRTFQKYHVPMLSQSGIQQLPTDQIP